MALRPTGICLGYLEVFVRASVTTLTNVSHGIIPGISRKDLLDLSIPLPPLAEQKAIVARVEGLFGALDAVNGSMAVGCDV